MHSDEELAQLKSGPVKIRDTYSQSFGADPAFKDRWAVLCPARLLLFKEKTDFGSKQLALAVYPIINTEFKLQVTKGSKMTELSLCFSEQVVVKDSNPVGPTVTKTLFISDPSDAQLWKEKLEQAQYLLKVLISSASKIGSQTQVKARES